jgi:hypothetical protein
MIADISTRLVSALIRNKNKFSPILGFALTPANARLLDISVYNKELQKYTDHEAYVNTLDHTNFIW